MLVVCADGEPQYRVHMEAGPAEALRAAGHELRWHDDGAPADAEAWRERLTGAEAVLLLWSLPAGVLAACPTIRVVSFAGTGAASYVDVDEAAQRGVTVANVPAYGANAIAEHAFALAFAVGRRIVEGDRLVRSGAWGPGALSGVELRGRRLGVVGAGPIGERAMEIGRALGMDVVAWTRTPSPERARALGVAWMPLEELFASADIVSLHLAHTSETEGIVSRALLERLRPDAILVNTARAQLVDTEALVELLDADRFAGAGIDVFEREPLESDHPLHRCARAVLTPHVGFNTPEASAELVREWVRNVLAFAAGQPRNVVA
jgi:phosphoglycerate dehydrogenase-like enzyme